MIWRTNCGTRLEVLHPGVHNTDQGPDFLMARLRIGEVEWIGHVELHVRSSDWVRHGHDADSRYDHLILHVVWVHDREVGPDCPTLELAPSLHPFLQQYTQQLSRTPRFIPCEQQIGHLPALVRTAWLNRMGEERLQEKAKSFLRELDRNNGDWEQTTWKCLAGSWGGPVNREAFEELAEKLPFRMIRKYRSDRMVLEALLMGVSGLLHTTGASDEYIEALRREYRYQKTKLGLREIQIPLNHFRMRPSGFPGIRLSQLAGLLHKKEFRVEYLRDTADPALWLNDGNVSAHAYWNTHCRLGEQGVTGKQRRSPSMGPQLLVNVGVVFLMAYGHRCGKPGYIERARAWLEWLKPEDNRLVRSFEQWGVQAANAMEGQGMIRLKKSYCDAERCLECALGCALIRQAVDNQLQR